MTDDPGDETAHVLPAEDAESRSAVGADAPADQPDVRRLEEQLRYALADLDNVRKRVDRTVAHERVVERGRCARLWLPVLDNLDLAVQHADGESPTLEAGVDTIRSEALGAMAALGFPRIDALDRRFDPAYHEALGTIDAADQPPGVVVAIVRNGYGGDPVLRPAEVMVSEGRG